MPTNTTTSPKARTVSINTASWLISRGINLDHAELGNDGNVVFVFPIDQASLEAQEGAFLSGAQCNGYALLASFRQLKKLIRGLLR